MKRLLPTLIMIALSLGLALCTAALTYSAPSEARTVIPADNIFQQVTPTPHPGDGSVIGSTDQIVIMGGVISAIIIVPILAGRKLWRLK